MNNIIEASTTALSALLRLIVGMGVIFLVVVIVKKSSKKK